MADNGDSSFFNEATDNQSFDFTMGYDVYKEGFRPMIWVRVLGAKGTVWFDGVRLEEVPAYEPGEPERLEKKITSRPYGLSGSFAPLERITVENAQKFRPTWLKTASSTTRIPFACIRSTRRRRSSHRSHGLRRLYSLLTVKTLIPRPWRNSISLSRDLSM